MKGRLVMGLSLAILASPAFALSCMRPDVARSYTEAAQAETSYVVVYGTLSFDEGRLPEPMMNESPPSTKIPARMTGHALSNGRFEHPFDRAITLDVMCFGPWCGGAESGIAYLGFLEVEEGSYTLTINPCGGQGFPEPTTEMLRRVEQCNLGGPCEEQSP